MEQEENKSREEKAKGIADHKTMIINQYLTMNIWNIYFIRQYVLNFL